MMIGRKVVQLACSLDNLFNPRITEFNDIARIQVNQVIVLHALVCFLKLGDILSELMFDYQAAVKQQFDGIVQGGSAYPVIFVLHEDIKGFDIEMTVP